jgi:hypothetical protein
MTLNDTSEKANISVYGFEFTYEGKGDERFIHDGNKKSFKEKISEEEFLSIMAEGHPLIYTYLECQLQENEREESICNMHSALNSKIKDEISKDLNYLSELKIYQDLMYDIKKQINDLYYKYENIYKIKYHDIVLPFDKWLIKNLEKNRCVKDSSQPDNGNYNKD